MTTRELMALVGQQPLWTQLMVLAAPPLIALLMSLFHEPGDSSESPWKYAYSSLIFVVFIPGIFSMCVTGYTLFIAHENLLDINIMIAFGPIVSMTATIQIMKYNYVDIDALPGFGTIMGLILLIAASSITALLLDKTSVRIWLIGSASSLGYLFLGILAMLYGAYYLLFHNSRPSAGD